MHCAPYKDIQVCCKWMVLSAHPSIDLASNSHDSHGRTSMPCLLLILTNCMSYAPYKSGYAIWEIIGHFKRGGRKDANRI
ncbi:hypothetical protein I7I48_04331 [Histoplasma ohiense]|nr:hypothetical protein I7I48_04331 [Histoplasma ohiense (nom. inval.)]